MRKAVETIKQKATAFLRENPTGKVVGWKKGEFDYDRTPAVFRTEKELEDIVYDGFSSANLSKFLIKEAEEEGKILVLMKPCDGYSFNKLLAEHKFERDKFVVLGVPCEGKTDGNLIRSKCEGVVSATEEGENVILKTLYDGTVTLPFKELLPERCNNCKSRRHVVYDELIGEEGETLSSHRFDEVSRIERMTPDERYAFWQKELSRCIRCNACRDVCPACTCEKCVFDNPDSGVENKSASNSFEEKLFHIIRAFHVAGRCTDCGECSRVCPQHIPLHLLNRKFIKDINAFYGEYQAGETTENRNPLVSYSQGDTEPADAVGKGGKNA